MRQTILILLLGCAALSRAQPSVLAAAGTVASGGNVTLSYTVGETAIAPRAAATTQVNEGFWQGYANVTDVADVAGVQIEIRILPNPTSGYFTLDLGAGASVALTATLFDLLGRAVETAVIPAGQSQIGMGDPNRESGLYLLRIATPGGRTVHTLRVLKI